METFERSAAPASLETFERSSAPAYTSGNQSEFLYPPGRTESDEVRKRREQDLAGDEELIRQLTSSADRAGSQADSFREDDGHLPRVGESRSSSSSRPASSGYGTTTAADDTHYGVEYHAMDSDSEDVFYAEPPRAAGYAPMICNVILGFLKASMQRSRPDQGPRLHTELG
eukprot:TRINITY_DN53977_c0_g1_i1.p1 TRINITY_DN53977_c0_g1~~TRINITY_DN53977_c0_g1_i1.p1  ORF type:complete len:171 (+),score=23.75 TRINITY_DN53977_c0_g1_i1:114-626(+)